MSGLQGHTMVAISVVKMTISAVICFSNVLTIVAICKFKNLKSGTNYLILSLCIADLSLGVTVPFCVINELVSGCQPRVCQACLFATALSLSVSTTTVVAIAMERFFAVVYPLVHRVRMSKKTVLGIIFVIWVYETMLLVFNQIFSHPDCFMRGISQWLSILYLIQIPILLAMCAYVYTKIYVTAVRHLKVAHGMRFHLPRFQFVEEHQGIGEDKTSDVSSGNTTSSQVTAITELLAESPDREPDPKTSLKKDQIQSAPTLSETKDAISKMAAMNSSGHENPRVAPAGKCKRCETCHNIKLARMTFLVLLVLFLCWLPFLVTMAVNSVGGDEHGSAKQMLFLVSLMVLYCNSFMNPVLYSWQNSDFRKAFRALLAGSLGKCFK